MLLINGAELAAVLTMEEAIAAMEEALREVARGQGLNLPRLRLQSAVDGAPGFSYFFHCVPGLLPSKETMAVRLVSTSRASENGHVSYWDDRYCGWVLVFSARSGEPLALIDD